MVGKLIKHELSALFRTLVCVGAVVLVLAILTRIGAAVGSTVFTVFTAVCLVVGILVLSACAFFTSVARFWTSLFTGEGYMTFSLPATPSQILLAKMLSAFIVMIFGLIVSAVAALIALSGISPDAWSVFGEDLYELFNVISVYVSSDPLIATEAAVYLLSLLPMSLLFFYLVMSVGQLFTKGRKGITFLLFIGVYWAVSLLNMLAYTPMIDKISELAGIHVSMWVQIAVNLALDFGMFFLIRFILLHKVNLIV